MWKKDPVTLRCVHIRSKSESKLSAKLRPHLVKALKSAGFLVSESWSGKPLPKSRMDLLMVMGGDGTLLSSIRALEGRRFDVPVLGLHTSTGLGFLYELKPPTTASAMALWSRKLALSLFEGRYTFSERRGLHASTGLKDGDFWALNDLVIAKGPLARMVELKIKVGNSLLFERLRGDGLIFASTTGSTAYSLSAGGPVVQPTLSALLLTPICPFEVAQRPLVLDGEAPVSIEFLDRTTPAFLTSDGQENVPLSLKRKLEISRSAKVVRLVQVPSLGGPSQDFFGLLRSKLRYGGR